MLRRLFARVYSRVAKRRSRIQTRLHITGRISWEKLREQFDAQ
jgi:hypothetical protein